MQSSWLRSFGSRVWRVLGRFVEFFAGAAAALLVYAMWAILGGFAHGSNPLDQYLVGDRHTVNAIAVSLVAVGALLSLSRRTWERTTRRRFEKVEQLSRVVDLSTRAQYDDLSECVDLYASIVSPYFELIRNDVLLHTRNQLRPMARSGQSPILQTARYVELEKLELSKWPVPDELVRAVATLFTGDLSPSESDEEREFVDANIRFVQRGGNFERTLVVTEDQVASDRYRDAIRFHQGAGGIIPAKVVIVEHLRDRIMDRFTNLLLEVGDGFLVFGTRVGFVDVYRPEVGARGCVVTERDRLEQILGIYQELEAHAVSVESTV